MKIKQTILLLLLSLTTVSYSQNSNSSPAITSGEKTVVFRFVADNDTFYIPWQDNGEKLDELVAIINRYKKAITDGSTKISVEGYSSYYPTTSENLKSAGIRANRVKSELILSNGIKEENFNTTVYASSHEGWKSVVVVTLRLPQEQQPTKQKAETKVTPAPKKQEVPQKEQVTVDEEVSEVVEIKNLETTKPYAIAFRTNLLYDAFSLPTLGIEWRISDRWGIKADWSGSYWGKDTGKVQKIWLVNPELRFYIGKERRGYMGVSGNFGEYNIYKGMIGGIVSKKTGYQGSFWNAGISGGYQLFLSKAFTLDFNLGLGYSRFSYDTFGLIEKVRVVKGKKLTKNFFGPTQVGINLIWTIGRNK